MVDPLALISAPPRILTPAPLPPLLDRLLQQWGLSDHASSPLTGVVLGLAIVATGFLIHFLFARLFLTLISWGVKRSHISWDDVFLESRFFNWLVQWIPAFVIYLLARHFLQPGFPRLGGVLSVATLVYMVTVGSLAIQSLLDALSRLTQSRRLNEQFPLTALVQLGKLLTFMVAALLIIAALTGQNLLRVVAGMGVMASVMMLIFKDSILGLVAGVQLSANRMIRPGDWIEMPKHGADGTVQAVGLTTVKVQNFDKTITTIPTYALVQESFKNWRGMEEESEGRRIKRSLHIDTNTVKRCSPEMLTRFEQISLLQDYLETKRKEIGDWNESHARSSDGSAEINSRRLTNLGTFRAYTEAYLRDHARIHQGMTLLVRHLPPTEHGLPLEIYCFANNKNWAAYEAIQADIFDHLLSVVPEFELRVYQSPSGEDVRAAGAQLKPARATRSKSKQAGSKA